MLFEYPSCEYNLAYDEAKGVCDYADQVEGCSLISSKNSQKDLNMPKSNFFIFNSLN